MGEADGLEFAVSAGVLPVVVAPNKMVCTLLGGQPELLRGGLRIHDDGLARLQFHLQNRPAAMALKDEIVL